MMCHVDCLKQSSYLLHPFDIFECLAIGCILSNWSQCWPPHSYPLQWVPVFESRTRWVVKDCLHWLYVTWDMKNNVQAMKVIREHVDYSGVAHQITIWSRIDRQCEYQSGCQERRSFIFFLPFSFIFFHYCFTGIISPWSKSCIISSLAYHRHIHAWTFQEI